MILQLKAAPKSNPGGLTLFLPCFLPVPGSAGCCWEQQCGAECRQEHGASARRLHNRLLHPPARAKTRGQSYCGLSAPAGADTRAARPH